MGNTLTGTAAEKAAYNLLNGYKNTGTNVSGVTVIGTNRTISNAKDTIVMGSSAGGITTTASKAVILGSEANAEKTAASRSARIPLPLLTRILRDMIRLPN